MGVELFMLDGSNCGAAHRTVEHVLRVVPAGLFDAAHICTPFLKWVAADCYDACKHFSAHHAPITYGNRRAYSEYVLYELPKLVSAEHFMIIHRDGYPLNPEKWDPEFLRHDYIGAPWGPEPEAVGNGGFCIRSKRLADWAAAQGPMAGTDNEDWHLCVHLREKARAAGFSFAPLALAARFSLEREIPELPRTLKDVFGFHGVQNRLDLLL